jgi:hypothetical protein
MARGAVWMLRMDLIKLGDRGDDGRGGGGVVMGLGWYCGGIGLRVRGNVSTRRSGWRHDFGFAEVVLLKARLSGCRFLLPSGGRGWTKEEQEIAVMLQLLGRLLGFAYATMKRQRWDTSCHP